MKCGRKDYCYRRNWLFWKRDAIEIISRKIIPLVKYDNIVCLKTTTYIDNYNNKYCSNDNNSVVNNAKYKNNKYIKYTNSNYNDEFLNRLYANRKYGNNC